MTRETFFLCEYQRTDEVQTPGRTFLANCGGVPRHQTRAPSYVYRLRRVSPALLLTQEEADAIGAALEVEGCPHLLPEAQATEGKRL